MVETNDQAREAQCILRMLIWTRAEIAFGLDCSEAAENIAQAIEIIGARFPDAHAKIIDSIAEHPFLARLPMDFLQTMTIRNQNKPVQLERWLNERTPRTRASMGPDVSVSEMARELEESTRSMSGGSDEVLATDLVRVWGVTRRTLRFYEERKLISPRRSGRARIYSQIDSHRIGLILRAKKLGFTLAEITDMLDAATSETLGLTAQKCLQQIDHLEGQMKSIVEALSELRRLHLALSGSVAGPREDRSTTALGASFPVPTDD
jgi:DNA-binding transcriptional MerR regulator